jgi:hypothetical protein
VKKVIIKFLNFCGEEARVKLLEGSNTKQGLAKHLIFIGQKM